MSLTDDALRKLQREGFFAVVPPATTPKKSDPRQTEEDNDVADTVPVELSSEPLQSAPQQEPPAANVLDSAPNEPPQESDIRDHHSVPDLSASVPSSEGRAAYDPVIPSFDELDPLTDDGMELDSARSTTDDHEWTDGLELAEALDDPALNAPVEDDLFDEDVSQSMQPRAEREVPDEAEVWEQERLEATSPPADPDLVESSEHMSAEDPALAIVPPEFGEEVDQQEVIDSLDDSPSAATDAAGETYEQTLLQRLNDPEYAQPFRNFQQNLLRTCGTELPNSLLVVSPSETARSAETVCHLALIWEESEDEILLVDANLEQQVLTRAFRAVGQPGLCDILGQQSVPDDVVRCTSRPRLHFVPCGDDRFGISRVQDKVDPKNLADLLKSWCHQYQRVFIDCGSIESLLMPALADSCDASLLVVCLRDVTFSQLENAAERLRRSSRRVLGCVLTDGLTDLAGQS